MNRILVLNQYFYPDIASTGLYAYEICIELAKKDEIIVIAAQPCYSKSSREASSFETIFGMQIHRVSIGGIKGRESFKLRLLSYFRYLMKAWKKANSLHKAKQFDKIITFHNPPFVIWLGFLLSIKYRTKFTIILYDLHPEVIIKAGWKIPLLLKILWKNINRFIYKKAERIIVISNGMKNILVRNYGIADSKIIPIPLWSGQEGKIVKNNKSVRELLGINKNEIIILYAGNMGALHPVENILYAAKILREEPIKFIFIGDGIKKQFIQNFMQKESLQNLILLPYQPEEVFLRILSETDACFVILGREMEDYALPSRLFTFISAGKPIISLASEESEVARIVQKYKLGLNARNEYEIERILRLILNSPGLLKEMGKNAACVYNQYFCRDKIIENYKRMIHGN